MSNANGIISATDPVTMTDIKSVLGVYNYSDIGGLINEANRLGKINMWAKHKPISYASVDKITDAIRGLQSVNWGISIPTSSGNALCSDSLIQYAPPTGGATSPYRMGDFMGYNHNSIKPFRVIMPEDGSSITAGEHTYVKFAEIMADGVYEGNLLCSDIFPANYKLLVAVSDNSVTHYKCNGEDTIDLADCPLVVAGKAAITIRAALVVGTIGTGWTTATDKTMYSLSDSKAMAKTTISVTSQLKNSHRIACSFSDGAIIMGINTTVEGSGEISATGRWLQRPNANYQLTRIVVSGTPLDGGAAIGDQIITSFPQYAYSPRFIYDSDWVSTQGNGTYEFRCPTVAPVANRAVRYTYTFEFTKL